MSKVASQTMRLKTDLLKNGVRTTAQLFEKKNFFGSILHISGKFPNGKMSQKCTRKKTPKLIYS